MTNLTNDKYRTLLSVMDMSVTSTEFNWFSAIFISTFFFFLKFYLFNFRERGREGEREGEKHQYVVSSLHIPYWEPGPQPMHVPRLGIKPAILWFSGRHSISWATPDRAHFNILLGCFLCKLCYLLFSLPSNDFGGPLKRVTFSELSDGIQFYLDLGGSLNHFLHLLCE